MPEYQITVTEVYHRTVEYDIEAASEAQAIKFAKQRLGGKDIWPSPHELEYVERLPMEVEVLEGDSALLV